MKQKIFFMQESFGTFEKGLAVVETKPTSAHVQAVAMLKNVYPQRYFTPYGIENGDVLAIPRFQGLVAENHPDSKEICGPFVRGQITLTKDKLSNHKKAYVSFIKDWPSIHAVICMNTEFEDGAEVYFGVIPAVHEEHIFVRDIYKLIEDAYKKQED